MKIYYLFSAVVCCCYAVLIPSRLFLFGESCLSPPPNVCACVSVCVSGNRWSPVIGQFELIAATRLGSRMTAAFCGCISSLLFVVSSLLYPRLNWKLFWRRHLKDRPKSLICAPRSEDRGTRSHHWGAMSEDTRVHPRSSLLDHHSLSAQGSGIKTLPPQLEHLNEIMEKQFKLSGPYSLLCNELIQMC